ncbi:PspA/IM30 family protein [Croceicoccus sp. F390]|uniref:PspA/IM30 family protein n=1 Tax=Croceicoccus esteveae TaxID=3075597 RepID=A0ABU2ZKG9_9SPHN|nr:PspA/IM30 family protein [Croceicoccus sp. F390]MDT0576074.1 PspA/IM30 family protein [Croceicoccus sp. F390]
MTEDIRLEPERDAPAETERKRTRLDAEIDRLQSPGAARSDLVERDRYAAQGTNDQWSEADWAGRWRAEGIRWTRNSKYGAPLMNIIARTRDIIAANFSDLLDRADDPTKMVRMIIVEMEDTLVDVRASAARTIADQKEMQRHCAQLAQLEADWRDKAQLALSRDREDLARGALVESRRAADTQRQLREEIAVLDEALRACDQDILKLQSRLREARSRQTQIAARLESAENRVKLRALLSTERVDEAVARFDQLERRVDFAEGRAEALYRTGLGAGGEPDLSQQIDALASDDAINAELAEMRRMMARNSDTDLAKD